MSPTKTSRRKYKHSPHTAWRRVEKESIVLDLNTSEYFSLNETATFIWERLGSGASVPEIELELSAEFDVKPEAAARDAREIIADFCSEKLLVPA